MPKAKLLAGRFLLTDRMAALLGSTIEDKLHDVEPDDAISKEELDALWQISVVLGSASREVAQDNSRTEITGLMLGDRTMEAVQALEKTKEAPLAA